MWCAHCQADVATEISADGQSLKCTTCGHEIRRVFAPSLHPETQSARELLERWAREDQNEEQAAAPAAENSPAAGGSPSDVIASTENQAESTPEPVVPKFPVIEPKSDADVSPLGDEADSQRPAIRHQLPFKRADEAPSESNPPAGSPSTEGPGVRRGQAPKPFRPPAKLRLDAAHGESPSLPAPRAPFRPGQQATDATKSTSPDDAATGPVAQLPKELTKPPVREPSRQPQFIKPPVDDPTEEPDARASGAASIGSGDSSKPPEDPKAEASERPQPRRRLDAAHALDVVPAPHLDMAPFTPPPRGTRPGRSEALWGQLLAYAGVGVLTVGTVLVLWGYFGSIESYASTGWLLSSAGQMLLFLGVVTLVSGGMQQTTHEVGTRIETLDGRIHRIEQSTHQLLKGPHFSRRKRRSRKESGQSGASDAKSA